MTELFNHAPRQDLEWTPPPPLLVKQAREAIDAYKAIQDARDSRNPTVEAKA